MSIRAKQTSSKQNKNKNYRTQLQIVYDSLYDSPKTMMMVDIETGVNRANICRKVSDLRKTNKIFFVKYDICKITNHLAGYLTTNPKFKPVDSQLTLFEE